MGSRTCGLTIDITFIKDSHSKSLTPWHHDQPYYQVQGEHLCGMWIGARPVERRQRRHGVDKRLT